MLQWIREQWHQAQLRESAKKSPPNQSAEREALLFSGLWRELQDNQLDSVVSAAGVLLERGSPQELIEACKILAHAHLNNHRHDEAVSYFRFVAEQQNTPDAWFNLATAATLAKDFTTSQPAYEQALDLCTTTGAATGGTDGSGSTSDTTTTVTGATAADRLSNLLVPTTSEILWGIVSGDILSTAWQKLTSNTGSLMSIGFQQIAEITGTPFKQIFNYIGGGATYICYVNGAVASYTTAIKYPVLAGGIAVRQETTGSVKAMMQLMPLKIDKVGAASVLSGNERYEMADNVQVYLWYKGQYYPTKLAQVDADGYQLTGWYDNFGCAAGKKVRVIIAVKND